jgi:ketosteroid isomerase-like protein
MATLKNAIEDLLASERLTVEEAADLHFAPSFRQRVGGVWTDRPTFLAGIAELRETIEDVVVEVLDELVAGDGYAERHIIELTMRDGGRIRQEVYVFAERDPDGRFVRIEEATVPLPPPGDRGHSVAE